MPPSRHRLPTLQFVPARPPLARKLPALAPPVGRHDRRGPYLPYGEKIPTLPGVAFMHPLLPALLCLLPAAPPARPAGASLDNLDFGTGRLTGWQGEGFSVTSAPGPGPSF